MTEACIYLEIVDDGIAEDTEVLTISVIATGLDKVADPQNTTVYILDNDGML